MTLALGGEIYIILVRPKHMGNIGAVARAMKNTGFRHLRIVGRNRLTEEAFRLAVHAEKNFTLISLDSMVEKVLSYPKGIKIGLLFGPERTGLESQDLKWANYCYVIPQAEEQPSYNLAGAVLITLFQLFRENLARQGVRSQEKPLPFDQPLTVAQQKECLALIIQKLTERGFIHPTNKAHMEERLHDLFGRLTITEKDKQLLLALFGKIPYYSSL